MVFEARTFRMNCFTTLHQNKSEREGESDIQEAMIGLESLVGPFQLRTHDPPFGSFRFMVVAGRDLVIWEFTCVLRMNRECLNSILNSVQGQRLSKLELFSSLANACSLQRALA